MNKQLLILPDNGQRFNRAQTKELREAGFVVLYLADPSKARQLTAEPVPFTGNDALIVALKSLRQADNTYAYRTFVEGLMKVAEMRSAQPQDDAR